MRRTQLASQVSLSGTSHTARLHWTTVIPGIRRTEACATSHMALAGCPHVRTALLQSPATCRITSAIRTTKTDQLLTFAAIAREEFPPIHTSLLFDPACATHIRYREPEGEGSVRLHLQQIPRHRPRIRCHCRRRWRSRPASGLRSR
jgi:hypothetical protein